MNSPEFEVMYIQQNNRLKLLQLVFAVLTVTLKLPASSAVHGIKLYKQNRDLPNQGINTVNVSLRFLVTQTRPWSAKSGLTASWLPPLRISTYRLS